MFRTSVVPLVLLCSAPLVSNAGETPNHALARLDVVATDIKGAPVTDLSAADIQVKEDGKSRPVVFFRLAGRSGPSGVAGTGAFQNHPADPVTIILLDRWNERLMTSATAIHELGKALAGMQSVERVYVYFLSNKSLTEGQLLPVRPLPDPDTGFRILDSTNPAELVRRLDEGEKSIVDLRHERNLEPGDRATITAKAIDILSRAAATLPGPKNLIWITHGFPVRFSNGDRVVDVTPGVQKTAESAARSRIAIYAVYQSSEGAAGDNMDLIRLTLEDFADFTGGRWYTSDRVGAAIDGALADARGLYRLAYTPVSGGVPSTLRVDAVRKGVKLLVRPNPADADTAQTAEDAFNAEAHSPFDATDVALRVDVSRNPGGIIHFDIRVDPRDLFLEPRPGGFHASFAVAFAFYRNRVLQAFPPPVKKELILTEEQFHAASKDGILISHDVLMRDPVDQARVMVYDPGVEGLGSVTIALK